MKLLSQHIESLIFTAEKPIKLKDIKSILEETFESKFKNADLENAIEEVRQRYESDEFAFEMVAIAEGYQFLTKGSYFNTVATFLKQTTRKRLSRTALETLAIIAYKQPVSRPELERIRGVSCDYAIHKLLEKEMVTILGRSESVGKPLLYGTSVKFMDYFGLKDLNDMPKPKDFKTAENSIGEAAPIEEETPNPNQKPKLELPITDLEEVVDMIVAILPPGPKVEIPEVEEEESETNESQAPTIVTNNELRHPANDLEEVVDMIAAILPPEPQAEIVTNEVSDESVQPIAKADDSDSSNVAEANNVVLPGVPQEAESKISTPAITDTSEQPKQAAAVVQPKSINEMFQAAIAITVAVDEESENISLEEVVESKSNELDEVVDVITATMPIENIPSESSVLNELIQREKISEEE